MCNTTQIRMNLILHYHLANQGVCLLVHAINSSSLPLNNLILHCHLANQGICSLIFAINKSSLPINNRTHNTMSDASEQDVATPSMLNLSLLSCVTVNGNNFQRH